MIEISKNTLKRILPALAFILLLIPIATSSLFNLQQKKANEMILEQKRAQKEAEENTLKKIYLTGKFDPAQRDDFATVPAEYDIGGYKMYLRKETLKAFLDMAEAAAQENIKLSITSATRNFDSQRDLWNNKWNGITDIYGQDESAKTEGEERFNKILEHIAVPGTSRHHWGTEIDINGPTLDYFTTEQGKKEYGWLSKNAPMFGFCQTYNFKGSNRIVGYNEEKWHWSYLPLSKNFTQEYKNLIKDSAISGFDGDQYVSGKDLINNYVLSINPDCL